MKLILTVLFLSLFLCTFSQVGINTDVPKATLQVVPQTTGATTAEGIIAPRLTRAQLISKDAKYIMDQQGTLIYVTAIDGTATTKTARITVAGYYYFDGSFWQPFDYNRGSFYLPAFNLPMKAISSGQTYDLYNNVYLKQFRKAGNATWVSSNSALTQIPEVYAANQLDFVVTFYDSSVIKVNSISAAGVLNYDVLNTNPTDESFLNIVLVLK